MGSSAERGVLSPGERLLEIVRIRDELNALSRALLESATEMFGSMSLALPNVQGAAELAFIRTVSWLYVLYAEAGRPSVGFLVQRSESSASPFGQHFRLVRSLRTWGQHNVDGSSPRDRELLDLCETWFERHCSTRVPRSEENWRHLLEALLAEAQAFLEHVRDALDSVERDEDRESICRQWDDRIRKDWPAHRYHRLIEIAAADLGRTAVDPVRLYERHANSINVGMSLIKDDADLELEARRLVERALLSEAIRVLPITGTDIIATFEIRPGPRVGQLLECARDLYAAEPCDKETLLGRIRAVCIGLPEGEMKA